MVSLVDDILIGIVGGWVAGAFCDEMLDSIRKLEESAEEKVVRLLKSPYISGRNALKLASDYYKVGDYLKAGERLQKAIDHFDNAGSQLAGIEQVHSYFLAASCCHLLYDFTAKKHFLKLALNSLDSTKQNKLNAGDRAQALAVGAVKIVPRTFFNWQSYVPFYSYYHIGKSAVDDYKSHIEAKKKSRNIFHEDESLPVFDCTISRLTNVLKEGINASFVIVRCPACGQRNRIPEKPRADGVYRCGKSSCRTTIFQMTESKLSISEG